MDLGIDDWKLPFECYSRGLEKLDCISRDPMVWSFAWSSDECLSNRITYQDRMDSNAGITIAYTEAQQMKCLWLSTQRKELSLVAQFTIPIDNCIVKTIMWWSPEYLLWCAIPKQHHPAMGITIGMSQMTTLSQSNTTQVATYSIPLDNLNYSIELSSSPHRNLIG